MDLILSDQPQLCKCNCELCLADPHRYSPDEGSVVSLRPCITVQSKHTFCNLSRSYEALSVFRLKVTIDTLGFEFLSKDSPFSLDQVFCYVGILFDYHHILRQICGLFEEKVLVCEISRSDVVQWRDWVV